MSANMVSSHQSLSTTSEPDPSADTAKLDMANKIRYSNYNSIWEQQKHFTWLISIILSAQAIVLAGTKLGASEKIVIISLTSVVGIMIALIGFRVQRIEGVYFCQANALFAKEYRAVYPEAGPPYHSQKPNKNIPELVISALTGRAGVRDHFQILFLAFMAVFTMIAIYAGIAF